VVHDAKSLRVPAVEDTLHEVPQPDLPLLGGETLELGDFRLRPVWTPGHTMGGVSLLVRLPHQNIILAGDTAHLREGIEVVNPMPFNVDTRQAA